MTPIDMGWSQFAKGGVQVISIPGNHTDMIYNDRITRIVATSIAEKAGIIEKERVISSSRVSVFSNPHL
jgi:hypothetical protein